MQRKPGRIADLEPRRLGPNHPFGEMGKRAVRLSDNQRRSVAENHPSHNRHRRARLWVETVMNRR